MQPGFASTRRCPPSLRRDDQSGVRGRQRSLLLMCARIHDRLEHGCQDLGCPPHLPGAQVVRRCRSWIVGMPSRVTRYRGCGQDFRRRTIGHSATTSTSPPTLEAMEAWLNRGGRGTTQVALSEVPLAPASSSPSAADKPRSSLAAGVAWGETCSRTTGSPSSLNHWNMNSP
jgi:hypothetical protein